MKITTVTLVVAVSAIAVTAGAALAKPGDRGARMNFETFDTNGDGQITREEAEAFRASRFAEVDSDGDGFVSLEELTARAEKQASERAQRMMTRLDSDGDGRLTEEDMSQGPRAGRMFDRLDSDEDGVITKAEFDAARDRMAKFRGHKRGSE